MNLLHYTYLFPVHVMKCLDDKVSCGYPQQYICQPSPLLYTMQAIFLASKEKGLNKDFNNEMKQMFFFSINH